MSPRAIAAARNECRIQTPRSKGKRQAGTVSQLMGRPAA
jgi:hypothetical protein